MQRVHDAPRKQAESDCDRDGTHSGPHTYLYPTPVGKWGKNDVFHFTQFRGCIGFSSQTIRQHVAVNVRQPQIAAAPAEGKLLVVDPQQVQNGGM